MSTHFIKKDNQSNLDFIIIFHFFFSDNFFSPHTRSINDIIITHLDKEQIVRNEKINNAINESINYETCGSEENN